MDKNAIALIGIADTLIHVLLTDKKAQKSKDASESAKHLEQIRQELLREGLRYSEMLGTARDDISRVSTELQHFLSRRRDLQWVLHGLVSVGVQDVEPPPLPSSSSSGPKSISPEVMQIAQKLAELITAKSDEVPQNFAANRLFKKDGKAKMAKPVGLPR